MDLFEAKDAARKFYDKKQLVGQKFIIVQYDRRRNDYDCLLTEALNIDIGAEQCIFSVRQKTITLI